MNQEDVELGPKLKKEKRKTKKSLEREYTNRDGMERSA